MRFYTGNKLTSTLPYLPTKKQMETQTLSNERFEYNISSHASKVLNRAKTLNEGKEIMCA